MRDLCFKYLNEAVTVSKEYVDIPLYDSIFSEEADEQAAKNNEVEKKTNSLIQKAINAAKEIMKKIRDAISNFITYIKTDKKTKENFKKFKEECKKNPEFANAKITIKNYMQIEKDYADALKKAENLFKSNMQMDDEKAQKEMDAILGPLKEKYKDGAKVVMTSISVQAALNWASQSYDNAATIREYLDKDSKLLEMIEEQIGKKEAKKFEKQVKHLTSRISLIRRHAGLADNAGKATKDAFTDLFSQLHKIYIRSCGNDKFREEINPLHVKDVASAAADGTKQAFKQRRSEKIDEKNRKFKEKMRKQDDKAEAKRRGISFEKLKAERDAQKAEAKRKKDEFHKTKIGGIFGAFQKGYNESSMDIHDEINILMESVSSVDLDETIVKNICDNYYI